jgi:hypothetical protein
MICYNQLYKGWDLMFYIVVLLSCILSVLFYYSNNKRKIILIGLGVLALACLSDLFFQTRILLKTYEYCLFFFGRQQITYIFITFTLLIMLVLGILMKEYKKNRKVLFYMFIYFILTLVVLPLNQHRDQIEFTSVKTEDNLLKIIKRNNKINDLQITKDEKDRIALPKPKESITDSSISSILDEIITTDYFYIILNTIDDSIEIYDKDSFERIQVITLKPLFSYEIVNNRLVITYYQDIGKDKIKMPSFYLDGELYRIPLKNIYHSGLDHPKAFINQIIIDLKENPEPIKAHSFLVYDLRKPLTTSDGLYFAENLKQERVRELMILDGKLRWKEDEDSLLYYIPWTKDFEIDLSLTTHHVKPWLNESLYEHQDYIFQVSANNQFIFYNKKQLIEMDHLDTNTSGYYELKEDILLINRKMYSFKEPFNLNRILDEFIEIENLHYLSNDNYLVIGKTNNVRMITLFNVNNPNLEQSLFIHTRNNYFDVYAIDYLNKRIAYYDSSKFYIYNFSDQFHKVAEMVFTEQNNVKRILMDEEYLYIILYDYTVKNYQTYSIQNLDLIEKEN